MYEVNVSERMMYFAELRALRFVIVKDSEYTSTSLSPNTEEIKCKKTFSRSLLSLIIRSQALVYCFRF